MTELDPGVEQTELPNGLRIVTETMPGARSVTSARRCASAVVTSPTSCRARRTSSSTCSSRAPTRSAKQIAESIDAVGGEMNAFTAREHTAFYARLRTSRWPSASRCWPTCSPRPRCGPPRWKPSGR